MAGPLSARKLRLVERTFLFEHMDEIVIERILSDDRCSCQTYPRGARIFDPEHFQRSLGLILSGIVRVDKPTPEGKYMKMSRLGPGECFGAAAMFVRRENYATVLTAEKPAEVLFIPEELIRWAMQRDFTITENYIRYLSNRIWFLNEKISGLTAGSSEQRLALFLLEHSADGVFNGAMTELSRQLNMGRASLYRAIDQLEAQALIRQEGKSLMVLNEEGLREFALPNKTSKETE